MHPCLEIPEILNGILNSSELDGCLSTFLSVALTCRGFSEPALNVLWSELNSLYPLIACMGIATREDDVGSLCISGPIYPSHLAILRKYAIRVRKYSEDSEGYPDISSTFLSLLYDAAGGSVLPSIREIGTVEVSDYGAYCKLRLITGSNVEEISLAIGMDMEEPPELYFASYLANLDSTKYPLLTSLSIWGELKEHGSAAFNHTLRSLPSITSLDLNLYIIQSPSETLQLLSKMPYLKDLDVQIGGWQIRPYVGSEDVIPHTFPSLEKLDFQSDFFLCMTLLDLIHPSNFIKTIEISVRGESITTHQWESLLQLISQRLSPDNLEKLDIDGCCFSTLDWSQSNPPIGASFLGPLARFSKLKYCWFGATQGFDLTDELLDQLARAWPSTQHIGFTTATSFPPKNTLGGLTTFADHCPELQNLAIPFDTSKTSLSRADGERRCGRKLHNLEVYSSTLDNPKRVAAFLSDIFPGIKSIHYMMDKDLQSEWNRVVEDIAIFAEVRLDERRKGRLR